MMRTWTNVTWPDDPYRTGQQLYRRPVPRLAAFTTWPACPELGQPTSMTAAIVYLPLHRTRAVTVTGQTLTFGFRASTASDMSEMPELAAMADLDLMQARRHAAILAGYMLGKDLAALRQCDGAAVRRGLAAMTGDWSRRGPAASRAAMLDCALDLPGKPPLGQACLAAGLSPVKVDADHGGWHPAALAVERALVIALLSARYQGRYDWSGALDTGAIVAATAWDCLLEPQPATSAGRSGPSSVTSGGTCTTKTETPSHPR
jgi:hypothetical protein